MLCQLNSNIYFFIFWFRFSQFGRESKQKIKSKKMSKEEKICPKCGSKCNCILSVF